MVTAPARFFRLTLRTHDPDGASTFYCAILGDGARDIVELHVQAVARGARPHCFVYPERPSVG